MRNEDPAQGITMKTSVVVMETGDNAGNGRRRLQPGATPRASDTIADSTSSLNLGAATTATENGYNEPPMELELGTVLPIEWTSQHACGPNDKTSCEIVLQYGCDATLAANGMPGLRDGTTTGSCWGSRSDSRWATLMVTQTVRPTGSTTATSLVRNSGSSWGSSTGSWTG